MELSMRNRCRGAMLGRVIGDALGAAYEWAWTPGAIKVHINAHGGRVPREYEPFDYIDPFKGRRAIAKGQPTADSELTAALALSLIKKKKFDTEDVYNRFRAFVIDGKSLLTAHAYAPGKVLKAALAPPSYTESMGAFSAGTMPAPPNDGSLMRCIPLSIALCKEDDSMVLRRDAILQSRLTHHHPSAQWACMLYSSMVKYVLLGSTPKTAWRRAHKELAGWKHKPEKELQELLDLDLSKPDDEWDVDGIGNEKFTSVVFSLRAGLWASMNAKDFADGIIKAISLGGYTNSYGAVAGGILGARFGLKGIPHRWQDAVQGRQVTLDLADRLYETFQS